METIDLRALIDHTLLKPEASRPQIEKLCQEARQYGFAAVCVNPWWVRLAAAELQGATVKVASVIGFPLGANATAIKVAEAERAIADGALELDMVINLGALKSGDPDAARQDIAAVARAAHAGGAILKVIIEAAVLDEPEKVLACRLAQEACADFVKTSTGFGPGGARVEDVALMRATVGPAMGVKAAGGIRSLDDALKMVRAGANRIGTSSGVRLVEDAGQ